MYVPFHYCIISWIIYCRVETIWDVAKSSLTYFMSPWRLPPQYCKYHHSSLSVCMWQWKAACSSRWATVSYKPSEYVQPLSVWMDARLYERDDHTQRRGDEQKGSFSQHYNDGECVQTKGRMGGALFPLCSLNHEHPERLMDKRSTNGTTFWVRPEVSTTNNARPDAVIWCSFQKSLEFTVWVNLLSWKVYFHY